MCPPGESWTASDVLESWNCNTMVGSSRRHESGWIELMEILMMALHVGALPVAGGRFQNTQTHRMQDITI